MRRFCFFRRRFSNAALKSTAATTFAVTHEHSPLGQALIVQTAFCQIILNICSHKAAFCNLQPPQYLRMPTANLFNQGMRQPGCMNYVCGEYGALFVSTASGFKGAGCPKVIFFLHARFNRRFCILLVFRATAETRGITAETRGITAVTRVQPVDVLRAFDCA